MPLAARPSNIAIAWLQQTIKLSSRTFNMEKKFDVFNIHEQIIKNYSDYVQSFLTIADDRTQRFIEEKVIQDRSLWPDALIQLNPAYEKTKTVADLAQKGSFNQRMKCVQKPTKDPTLAEIAELAVFLAAPESSIRWLAGASLAQIGGQNAVAAIETLLKQDISEEAREEAMRTLKLMRK